MDTSSTALTRAEISEAVDAIGWRLTLRTIQTAVAVDSLHQATQVAAALAHPNPRLRLDLRPNAVLIALDASSDGSLVADDLALAAALTDQVRRQGLRTEPNTTGRSAHMLEIAIDAMDADAIRPFWLAVLGYELSHGELLDPLRVGPSVWFQQMDTSRPQRNRIHIDVNVPHDEAPQRIAAALGAGGRITRDAEAPAFWVLTDAEGNEACISTWQGRD